MADLTLSRGDSRIILNRGLIESTKNSGLDVRSHDDSLYTDSIDSKQAVKRLCASQKYFKMDFFLTFTCNQSEHFGMQRIKRWVDDCLWQVHFPMFERYSIEEKSEICKAMEQSSAGLILRNWMEVREIFLNHLYTSSSSPYFPVREFFSRTEYQSDVGNLPHMHMMVCMNTSGINKFKNW